MLPLYCTICKFVCSHLNSKMCIAENLRQLNLEIGAAVKIIAVSKFQSVKAIQEAYDAGQKRFGENKVQEIILKYPLLPKDIEWHFLGHLQTNKVRFIAPFVHMIHSVDSLKLLQVINKEASRSNRVINCLLQFHVASEETKFGLDFQEAIELVHAAALHPMQNICFAGVMGMASLTGDLAQIRAEFKTLKTNFDYLKRTYFQKNIDFREISMGMSGDYHLAIEEGSTMVRIGTLIFGNRNDP